MRMQMGCPDDHVEMPNVDVPNYSRVETKEALKQEGLIARMVLAKNNLINWRQNQLQEIQGNGREGLLILLRFIRDPEKCSL